MSRVVSLSSPRAALLLGMTLIGMTLIGTMLIGTMLIGTMLIGTTLRECTSGIVRHMICIVCRAL